MKIKLELGLKNQPASFFFEGELKTFKQTCDKKETMDYCSLLNTLKNNGYIVQNLELTK